MAKKAPEVLGEPRPTVREAMRYGAFAGAKLVAGEQGLDRQIEWVRLMETPDIQPRSGDLLLTTGFPIKDDRAAQIRLIGRIADSGAVGLVVKPLPYLKKLAPEMLSESERDSLMAWPSSSIKRLKLSSRSKGSPGALVPLPQPV